MKSQLSSPILFLPFLTFSNWRRARSSNFWGQVYVIGWIKYLSLPKLFIYQVFNFYDKGKCKVHMREWEM